ncbi:UbiA family prenyltransferase [Thermosynechococcus sp. JY1334]|uniref:UbiA family prenyltransferase n=1 Tax=unclassified Thermosynechococcus TaxID=2622553 RepID=UPI0026719E70|nr:MULTISPECIES: UbiA family prenyltransferase [unclassified Thermosynechococcus]MDR7898154.1 UbiA family prenyltransferase [Thermosynechococcus sp. JY1332]MDR7905555.1 UbiA family prenyltransferase [Thermosynechococcus sp. JY1334]WKT85287.1 UbiA family prenyltransferase [Thermosynechococcus sp. JY1339]WNC54230.1 UbiA family prenyltransferase [Thermosynechococcus sp. JY1331]
MVYLLIDLDSTLLKTDILLELIRSSLAQALVIFFQTRSFHRAQIKRKLASLSKIEVTSLPYNSEVIQYIQAWKAKGGKVALVTATDQLIADKIAAHLGLFDEVYGSDDQLNLKGEHKARFIVERFGEKNFIYMGDSEADLPVWAVAAKAITVNASPRLCKKVEQINPNVEHLGTAKRSIQPYLKEIRPHQWVKNSLVFVPMLAAHQFDLPTFWISLVAAATFSLTASSVYVLNDLLDLQADRAHPRKRHRPFAAGDLPLCHGIWMILVLLGLGMAIATTISWPFLGILLAYYGLTTAYSFYLKRRIIIDICTLAGLYTIRIFAGAVATGISLSVWLLAFSIFFFFCLATVKRQAELVDHRHRKQLKASGRGYHIDDLPIISMMAIGAGYVSILVLALYINSPQVQLLYTRPQVLWGICCVLLYWITRTIMITHRGLMHDDPIVYAIKDRQSQLCFLICLFLFIIGGIL